MKKLSTTFSRFIDEGSPNESATVLAMPRRKGSGKKKPVTDFQKYLAKIIDESGLSRADIERLSTADGWRIPASTVTSLMVDVTNHQIKTIECLARVLGKDPLEVISMALDEPPSADRSFAESRISTAWNLYRRLENNEDRRVADRILDALIAHLRESPHR